jgi:hypothetical protein
MRSVENPQLQSNLSQFSLHCYFHLNCGKSVTTFPNPNSGDFTDFTFIESLKTNLPVHKKEKKSAFEKYSEMHCQSLISIRAFTEIWHN